MNYFYSFLIVIAIVSCKPATNKTEDAIDYQSIQTGEKEEVINSFDTVGEGLPIFYNMYLTVEMSTLFESAHAVFNQDLLNQPVKTSDYITNSKKALNLGVYAVDLSYCRIFEQFEIAGRYFNSMQKLSEELGIPADFFINTSKRFEKNINDRDSLIKIANEVYFTTDNYLRENEQYGVAAQIILGGWIEAVHIASNVALYSKDPNIIERYADQKYSLKNLLLMLSNYPEDEVIKHYVKRLNAVDNIYSTFDFNLPADLNPDSSGARKLINQALVKIRTIEKQVNAIRHEIID